MARWQAGHSGNPKGRPRGAVNKSTRAIKEILQDNVDYVRIVKRLQQKALRGSEIAARILLEFGFGKPRQENEHTLKYSTINLVSAVRGEVSDEDRKRIMQTDENEQAQE